MTLVREVIFFLKNAITIAIGSPKKENEEEFPPLLILRFMLSPIHNELENC